MKENIIFLDIDGVVYDQFKRSWFPGSISLLQQLCEETDAGVVITSTWRITPGVERTKEILAEAGLKAPIVGHTEWVEPEGIDTLVIAKPRGVEIQDWIDRHGVHSYVVIDDSPIEGHANFVRCDTLQGFGSKEMKKCLSYFISS